MNEVKVGELYRLSQGRRGYPPGAYTLTERLIYDNSIDPLDPDQEYLIEAIKESSLSERRRLAQIHGSSNGYGGMSRPVQVDDYVLAQ